MADQTTEVLLGGIRADTRTLLTEARERGRSDQQKAVETMRQAAQEQMSRIDKRISELQARR